VPDVVLAPFGTRRVAGLTIRNGKVIEIELRAEPERLSELKIETLS
jgi:hypothetical protein